MAEIDGYKYGECRVMFGHPWKRKGPSVAHEKQASWVIVHAVCQRCTMQRKTVIDGRGEVKARTYRQPEGYHLDREVKRNELRLATLQGWKRG